MACQSPSLNFCHLSRLLFTFYSCTMHNELRLLQFLSCLAMHKTASFIMCSLLKCCIIHVTCARIAWTDEEQDESKSVFRPHLLKKKKEKKKRKRNRFWEVSRATTEAETELGEDWTNRQRLRCVRPMTGAEPLTLRWLQGSIKGCHHPLYPTFRSLKPNWRLATKNTHRHKH